MEIAERSDAAVAATVVDILPSKLNTADGRFPSAAQIKEHGLVELTVYTEVLLSVTEILSRRQGVDLKIDGKDELLLIVGGGTVLVDLDEEQARALGIMDVTIEDNIEVETPVTSAVNGFAWGSAPHGDLREGEDVVLFLNRVTFASYEATAAAIQGWGPVHSGGMLHSEDNGDWVDSEGDVAPLTEMVDAIR